MGELIQECGKGSTLEKIRIHRTKCSKIIKNVISPAFKAELPRAMKGKKFSLLVDESTDVSLVKHAAFAARYFDVKTHRIETVYLGVISVIETTGAALFEALNDQLSKSGLEIQNCVGYSSDGASNMLGENNSVWSRIRDAAPLVRMMPCTCHSLALCVQVGFEALPANLGFMLKDIPGWFRKSALRRDAYLQLFTVMNSGEDEANTARKPFTKMCATRWLVRGKVMTDILGNWDELCAYNSTLRACLAHKMLGTKRGY